MELFQNAHTMPIQCIKLFLDNNGGHQWTLLNFIILLDSSFQYWTINNRYSLLTLTEPFFLTSGILVMKKRGSEQATTLSSLSTESLSGAVTSSHPAAQERWIR